MLKRMLPLAGLLILVPLGLTGCFPAEDSDPNPYPMATVAPAPSPDRTYPPGDTTEYQVQPTNGSVAVADEGWLLDGDRILVRVGGSGTAACAPAFQRAFGIDSAPGILYLESMPIPGDLVCTADYRLYEFQVTSETDPVAEVVEVQACPAEGQEGECVIIPPAAEIS